MSDELDLRALRKTEAEIDAQFVADALRGDERAFAQLIERYGQPILSLCIASTLDREEARDLAQEIFLLAWRDLCRFRREAAFSTWLFALARNACVDASRRRAARPQLAPADESDLRATALAGNSDDPTVVAIFAVAARLPRATTRGASATRFARAQLRGDRRTSARADRDRALTDRHRPTGDRQRGRAVSAHASIEQLSALIDGELSLVAREAVAAHLRDCSACAAQHEELVEVAATLAAVPAAHWAAEMTTDVLERATVEPRERNPPVRANDWSLPIATMLALVGLVAVALAAPFPTASALDGVRLNIFAAFAEGAGLPFSGFLAVLLLLPALGLLAVPLLRQR